MHWCCGWQGGPFKYPTPRALDESEISGIIEAYAAAAKNALAAGFDGVEVRGYPPAAVLGSSARQQCLISTCPNVPRLLTTVWFVLMRCPCSITCSGRQHVSVFVTPWQLLHCRLTTCFCLDESRPGASSNVLPFCNPHAPLFCRSMVPMATC